VLKEQYDRVIADGGRVAGPAADALLNNEIGQDTLGPCEWDLYLRAS
jgi:hypothetical protein